MYVCICNAITQKMLAENSFLMDIVGNKCGKCIENKVFDGERMTYFPTSKVDDKNADSA
jgi:bacterioferritin-associated ferredoxin